MNGAFDRSRGLGVLLRELASDGADMLRGEVRLGRIELAAVTAGLARGTTQVAFGGAMLLLGVLSLLAGIVLLAGDQWLPQDRYWFAALLALVVAGVLSAWFAKRGAARLSASELSPDQTLETLKEDKTWLNEQLTSGATSN